MKNKVLYIILGMHRSGTSVTANMLNMAGIPFGDNLIGPAFDNEKGFWEDKDIVDLNERLFSELGIQWDSLNQFSLNTENFRSKNFKNLKFEAQDLLKTKFATCDSWGFKDPRASRLMPFWQPIFEDLNLELRYLLPFRLPSEVQASLAARNRIEELKAQWLWFLYNLNALKHALNEEIFVVSYELILSNPKLATQRLCEKFDIDISRLRTEAIDTFCDQSVDQALRHHKHDSRQSSPNNFSGDLYRLLIAYEASKITKLDLAKSITKLGTKFSKQTELNLLLDYAGELETDKHSERSLLQDKLKQQFDEFHEEETRLIANIEELSSANDSRFLQIKTHEKAIENLKHQNQKAADELEAQRGEIPALEEKLSKSRSSASKLENKLKQSMLQVEELSEENKELSKKTKKLDQEVTRTKLASKQDKQAFLDETAKAEHAFELEKMRLWEIVEKYRLENKSTFFRVRDKIRRTTAYLLRIEQDGNKSLFFLIKHRSKLILRGLVYLLPKDSKVRHTIVQLFIRVRCALKGDIDGRSLRQSHNEIIGNRQVRPVIVNESTDWPDLDLSVVSHNNGQWIRPFLTSLTEQNFPISKISFVVVDNESTDDTLNLWLAEKDILGDKFKSFTVIKSKNLGFGGGHNTAFASSNSPFVMVSNIDLEFSRDAITNVVSYAVMDRQDVASWELRQQPYEHPKFYDPVSLEVSWSSHACVLIRRECFEHVKGYEKRIFMYGEDVELSYRFRAFGYKIKYFPKSLVYHHTYAEEAEIKPLQFSGSTLANSYLRLRYGTLVDVLSIPSMYLKLLSSKVGVPNSRRVIWANIKKTLANTPYFLSTRLRNNIDFSFRGWDYEMIRDGSFYQAPCLKNSDNNSNNVPLVSVITRTYKGREYFLREALSSIVNQTHANMEVVVVEDGGTTMKPLVEEFELHCKDVTFIYKALPKKGRCYSGNQGLSLATGKYLMFLDDDDLLFCDHIETAVCELEHDSRLSAVYALSWDVETKLNGTTVDQGYIEMSHSTSDILRQEFDRKLLQHHNYISIQSIVFQKELYLKHGGFDESLDNLEDWNLWVKYSSNSTFKLINKTTSMFRTPWNVVEKANRQKVLDAYYEKAVSKNKMYIATNVDQI